MTGDGSVHLAPAHRPGRRRDFVNRQAAAPPRPGWFCGPFTPPAWSPVISFWSCLWKGGMGSGKLLPSLHLCFPICAWGPGDQAIFWLGRLEVASLHSAARFACLPHSTLPLGLALPWPCSPSPCCPRTWLPFLREFVGVRSRSPVHPRCVPARCPPRGSLWPWICLREIRLHIPVCGAPGEMLAQ